jgi:hypothetical protein
MAGMEKRQWRIRSSEEIERAMYELGQDDYSVRRDDRLAGKFLTVETGPENWPHVEGLLSQIAPGAEPLGD